MLKVALGTIATIAALFLVIWLRGGSQGVLMSLIDPFGLATILVSVIGVGAATGGLCLWRQAVVDLRNTNPGVKRENSRDVLAAVRSAQRAAIVGGVLSALFSLIHLIGNIAEPPEVIGHMVGTALTSIVWGIMIAEFLFAPMGARLAKIYHAGEALKT